VKKLRSRISAWLRLGFRAHPPRSAHLTAATPRYASRQPSTSFTPRKTKLTCLFPSKSLTKIDRYQINFNANWISLPGVCV
jgi:hypothetical protein